MSGANYDPCEYLSDHRVLVQQLLRMLRQSDEDPCSNWDCNLDGLQPQQEDSSMMLLMMGWVILGVVLYLFRPNSLRFPSKPGTTRYQDPDTDHPPPPATN